VVDFCIRSKVIPEKEEIKRDLLKACILGGISLKTLHGI
jgi:hypothetical protein